MLETDMKYIEEKTKMYLDTLKQTGIDIKADKNIVDWKTAARRWAVECLMNGKMDDNIPDNIHEDIDTIKYYSGTHVPFVLNAFRATRICRGGDCRGEPYYIHADAHVFVSCRNAKEFVKAIIDLSLYVHGNYVKIEAFNGHEYYWSDWSNEVQEFDENGNDIGVIKYKVTPGYFDKKVSIVEDTTSLFKWESERNKQLTDEEMATLESYTDDGCE